LSVTLQSFETLGDGDAAVASFPADDCEPHFLVLELSSVFFFDGESHTFVSHSFVEGVLEGGPPHPEFPGKLDGPD